MSPQESHHPVPLRMVGQAGSDLTTAFSFLTRLPVPRGVAQRPGGLGASTAYFPVVGGLVGVVWALVAQLGPWLGPFPTAAVILVVEFLLTGGLHWDAAADAADGLLGTRDRERALEVMRDSRVGSLGATAAALLAILLAALMAELIGAAQVKALVVAPILSRFAMVAAMAGAPAARRDGLAVPFLASCGWPQLAAAAVLSGFGAWWLTGPRGLAALALAGATALAGRAWCLHRLGGITGDTIGAIHQVSLGVVLAALAWGTAR